MACRLATEQAGIESAAIDNRQARSERYDVQLIATSRVAIARSREMLALIVERPLGWTN
jgi:hypothetical protein